MSRFFGEMKILLKLIADKIGLRKWPLAVLLSFRRELRKIINSVDGKTILIINQTNGFFHLAIEVIIAYSLILRGNKVVFTLCQGQKRCVFFQLRGENPCKRCQGKAGAFLKLCGFKSIGTNKYITESMRVNYDELYSSINISNYKDITYNNCNLFNLSRSSIVNELFTDIYTDKDITIIKDYLIASAQATDIVPIIINKFNPDMLLTVNGTHPMSRYSILYCKGINIPIYSWESTSNGRLIIRKNMGAIDFHISKSEFEDFKNIHTLGIEENKALNSYLEYRIDNKFLFRQELLKNKTGIFKSLSITPDDFIITLFPNLSNDSAVVEYPGDVFPTMFDWLDETINFLKDYSNFKLVVRPHPAELLGEGGMCENYKVPHPVAGHIKENYPNLQKNIIVLEADTEISSYALLDISDMVLVYTSNIGFEAILRGIPTLQGGNPHYHGHGITYEYNTVNKYHEILIDLISKGKGNKLDDETVNKARELFFLIYFVLTFPLDVIEVDEFYFYHIKKININKLFYLAQGKNKTIDFICDYILGNEKNYFNRSWHNQKSLSP